MINQFKSIINTYLASKINYSLLIDGGWGEGKTFYLKEGGFKVDTGKKVIYTTVYGIKDLKELDDQIVYEKLKLIGKLGKMVTSKNGNVILSIAKTVAKGFLKNKLGVGEEELEAIDDTVKKAKAFDISETMSISEEEVLVIDDLERLDETISYKQLLGYISANYIEGSNIKVILIGNEKELQLKLDSKTKKEEYQTIKEKTIWQTVKFETSFQDSFSSILNSFDNISFQSKMKNLKPYIVAILNQYQIHNLRTLQYLFHCLLIIFREDEVLLLEDDDNLIVRSLIILVNEYKTSGESFNVNDPMPKHFNLEQNGFQISLTATRAISKHNSNEELTPIEAFLLKYHENDKDFYVTYLSLFRLVFNGFLDAELLNKESQTYLKLKSPTEQRYIDFANLFKVPKISLEDFTKSLESVKVNLTNGEYDMNRVVDLAYLFENCAKAGYIFPIERSDFHALLFSCLELNNDMDEGYRPMDTYSISDYPKVKLIVDKVNEINDKKSEKFNREIRLKNLDRLISNEYDFTISIMDIIFKSDDSAITKVIEWLCKSSKNIEFFAAAIRRSRNPLYSKFKDKANIDRLEMILNNIRLKSKELMSKDFIYKGVLINNENYILKLIDQYKNANKDQFKSEEE